MPARPNGSPGPEHRYEERVSPDQHTPQGPLTEAPAGELHARLPYEPDRVVLVPCQPPEAPVEVDILADPRMLVVASDQLEHMLAAELRRAPGLSR